MLTFLLESTLAATALLGLVFLARRPVRRRLGAEAALALWLAPALALVLPPTGLGLLVIGEAGSAAPLAAPAAPVVTLPVEASPLPPPPADAPPSASGGRLLGAALLGAWVLGAAGCLGAAALRHARWRATLLAEAVPVPPSLAAEANRILAARRVRPRLIVSGAAATPQVVGLVRPLLAVPPGFAEGFAPEERRLALTHEAEHVAHRDLLLLAAAEAAVACHWFNPALRLALAPLRADIEAACDARVLRGGATPSAYAQTLLRAARGCPAPARAPMPALTLTSRLDGRIDAMRHPASPAARLLGTTAITALAALAAATAQVQEREEEVVIERSTDDDPNFRFERSIKDGRSEVRLGEGGQSFRVGGEDAAFVLLSDPFSDLVPPAPEAPEANAAPPAPPSPPSGFGERRSVREIKLRLPEGTDLGDLRLEADRVTIEELPDGGEQLTIVNPTDETMEALEAAVERTVKSSGVRVLRRIDRREETEADFEFEMERFEAEMDRFGAEMGAFGEEMGAWGARMGEVGGAIGRLADACEDHKARTDAPTVLTERVGEDAIRAVCASGGGARYQSGELTRFVRRNPDLTRAEKRAFLRNRDAESTVSVNR